MAEAPAFNIIGAEIDSLNISTPFNEYDVLTAVQIDDSATVASEMLNRAKSLLRELEQFESFLAQKQQCHKVSLRVFKSDVSKEIKILEKVMPLLCYSTFTSDSEQISNHDTTEEKAVHTLKSSNLPFYEAVWSAAKTSHGVIALRNYFPLYMKGQAPAHGNIPARNSRAMVDVVAGDGSEWIKVSLATEKRIIYDLAKAGYVGSSSDEENDDYQIELDDSMGLLKQVKDLIKASGATRVRYRHPKIILVLPRIRKHSLRQVEDVLEQIRALGVSVETADGLSTVPPVGDILSKLAPDETASFSETINLDCTILLAFVSDLSHGRVEPKQWHSKYLARQIQLEAEDKLLPRSLWPACGSRNLVCTREAATRMQEIVEIVGTETEKKRAALFIEQGDYSRAQLTREQRIGEFQKLSDYAVPLEWNLPVVIVDVNLDKIRSNLPPVAHEIEKTLIDINKSVFFYGWSSGRTTLTSNGQVAKRIQAIIEENRITDTDSGPNIWLNPNSRSLVGKENDSIKGISKSTKTEE